MKLKHIFLLQAYLLGAAMTMSAQEPESCVREICSCDNDPTPAGVMISHVHPAGEWMVSYRYMDMNMSGPLSYNLLPAEQAAGSNYRSTPDKMNMRMHMLMGMYGLSSRFTLMLMLQYKQNLMQMSMPVGNEVHQHFMKSSGPGDTWVYGLYAPIKKENLEVVLFTGLGLPTGSIYKKGDRNSMMFPGTRLPYSMQTGYGTLSGQGGINFLLKHGDFSYSGQASLLSGFGKNALGYSAGRQSTFNAWSAWQWCSSISNSLRLEGNMTQSVKGRDTSLDLLSGPDANPINYGGRYAMAFAGISLKPKKSWMQHHAFSLEYGLPVYQKLNGIQLPIQQTIAAAWTIKI